MRKRKVLLKFGILFDHPFLRPTNKLVRFVYIFIFTPALRLTTSLLMGSWDIKLIPRHSARTGIFFNPFFSDLDLSIIFSKHRAEEHEQLERLFIKFKKIFIFIGEVEFYTEDEYVRCENLKNKYLNLHNLARNCRKMTWLLAQKDRAIADTNDYDRYKIKRSIENLHKMMFSAPNHESFHSTLLLRLINDLSLLVEVPSRVKFFDRYFSEFIGITICAKGLLNQTIAEANDVGHLQVRIPSDLIVILLGAMPFYSSYPDVNQSLIQFRHKNPKIKSLFKAFVEIELLTVGAAIRARAADRPHLESWKRILFQMLID